MITRHFFGIKATVVDIFFKPNHSKTSAFYAIPVPKKTELLLFEQIRKMTQDEVLPEVTVTFNTPNEFTRNELEVWDCLTRTPNISSLDIRHRFLVDSFRDSFFGPLNDCELAKVNRVSKLLSLRIASMPITGKAFRSITALKNLRRLELAYCKCLDTLFEYVAHLDSLDHLVISDSKLRKPRFENLIHLKKLNFLQMNSCKLKDDAFTSFPPLPSLEWLTLGHNRLTGESLSFISKMKKFKNLTLINNPVTKEGLEVVASSGSNNVEDLHFTNTSYPNRRISDQDVSIFLQMKKLKSLSLSGCRKITNKILDILINIRTLRFLHLHETKVTMDALKSIQKKLPYCYFYLSEGEQLDAIRWSQDND